MPRSQRLPIEQQVIVITGASSGVGRCTALHLAARGARVALVARGEAALRSLVEEIEAAGGEALALAGDVADPETHDRLAAATLARWGRIDTWVNNAALFIQGRVQDIEPVEYRRVLEVNLLGVILGTRRAIEAMHAQGSGVVVQVSSIVGRQGAAFFGAYAAGKQGIDGFSEAARAELWGSDVHISTVYLPALDTPIYQHARGKLGTAVKPAPPVSDPERAARAIARLAETGEVREAVGWFRHVYEGIPRISPRLGAFFLNRTRGFTRTALPAGPDNLDASLEDARIRGGWADAGWRGFTVAETVRVLPGLTLAAAAVAGFLAARVLRR